MGRRTRGVVGVGTTLVVLVLAGCSDDDIDVRDIQDQAENTPDEAPVAYQDHWHAAYGFYICDEWQPNLPEFEVPGGTHTHGDGVIHIHPFAESRSGDNATLMNFLDDAGVSLTDDELRIGDQEWVEGETTCDGEDAELEVTRWEDVQFASDEVETVTDDFDDLRFEQDGEGYTIAFVPDGADVPLPETAENLAELGAVDSSG